MKKLIVLVMLMSLMFATGFRGNAWGTKEANLKETLTKSPGGLYNTVMNNQEVGFAYYFFEGKLYKGIYVCDTSKTMYDYFSSIIKSKYGEPIEKKVYDSDYNNYMTYTENLEYGNIILYSRWIVGETTIEVMASKHTFVTYVLSSVEEQKSETEKAKTAELF
jgi:hypothetical protein